MEKGLVDDEETDLEGKPGLTDCGLPLLNTVSLPGYWRACCQKAEQGEEADGGEGGHPADQGGGQV